MYPAVPQSPATLLFTSKIMLHGNKPDMDHMNNLDIQCPANVHRQWGSHGLQRHPHHLWQVSIAAMTEYPSHVCSLLNLHAQFYACVPLKLLLKAEGRTLHRTACIFGKTHDTTGLDFPASTTLIARMLCTLTTKA